MILKTHGRSHCSPISGRPHCEWPGDKRLAFYVTVNVEHFHFGEDLGHTPPHLDRVRSLAGLPASGLMNLATP